MRLLQDHIFEVKGASGCLSSMSQFSFLGANGRGSSHTPITGTVLPFRDSCDYTGDKAVFTPETMQY